MDTVSPAKRSYVMSKVKGRDSNSERIVRRLVYHAGFRYRLCDPRLPGKPYLVVWECELKETDILLEKMKTFLKE